MRDHPRMCGEHSFLSCRCMSSLGSSPHVRGARCSLAMPIWPRGIIPACAGSTRNLTVRWRCARDHPRMCGEHAHLCRPDCGVAGSSPHVRGARGVTRGENGELGIIPACAGSTDSRMGGHAEIRDHPRMCGEHSSCTSTDARCSGSSPHVRGAPSDGGVEPCGRGIIPACAGSTDLYRDSLVLRWDHPRMCGEHTSKIA